MPHIMIILGSTRPNRFGVQPAEWVYELVQTHSEATYELVDLKELDLPLLDEPIPPSQHKYTKDHTKKWSEMVSKADGFIIVTAEYNHGIPAALKNAIDYLFDEWAYKPVSFVSYGSLAGGARAVEHLRGVAGEVKMYDLRYQLLLPDYWNHFDENGKYTFTQEQENNAHAIIKDTAFWSEQMKQARDALVKRP